jgi:hypothetical protein
LTQRTLFSHSVSVALQEVQILLYFFSPMNVLVSSSNNLLGNTWHLLIVSSHSDCGFLGCLV